MASDDRPGRRGTETRQRAGIIGFRASADERAELTAAAERVGLSLGGYIRAATLNRPKTRATRRPTVEQAALAQILAQLGKCGSNLNQIARVLNTTGEGGAQDIEAALADFRAACGEVMRTLGRVSDPARRSEREKGAA